MIHHQPITAPNSLSDALGGNPHKFQRTSSSSKIEFSWSDDDDNKRRQSGTSTSQFFLSLHIPPLHNTKRWNRNVEHHQGKEERSFRHRRRCVARIHHPLAQESMLIIPIHSHFVTLQALRSIIAICLVSVRSFANRRSVELSMSRNFRSPSLQATSPKSEYGFKDKSGGIRHCKCDTYR